MERIKRIHLKLHSIMMRVNLKTSALKQETKIDNASPPPKNPRRILPTTGVQAATAKSKQKNDTKAGDPPRKLSRDSDTNAGKTVCSCSPGRKNGRPSCCLTGPQQPPHVPFFVASWKPADRCYVARLAIDRLSSVRTMSAVTLKIRSVGETVSMLPTKKDHLGVGILPRN
jgi:hypothetical protein